MVDANNNMGNNIPTKPHVITQDPTSTSPSHHIESATPASKSSRLSPTCTVHKTVSTGTSVDIDTKDSTLVNRNVFTNVLHYDGDTVQSVHTPKDVIFPATKPDTDNVDDTTNLVTPSKPKPSVDSTVLQVEPSSILGSSNSPPPKSSSNLVSPSNPPSDLTYK